MDMTSASVVRSHTPMGLRALPVRGRGLLLRHDRRTIAVAATVEGNAGRPLPERSGGVPPAGWWSCARVLEAGVPVHL